MSSTARAYAAECLALRQSLGDREGEGQALNVLGLATMYQGDHRTARDYHERSLAIKRELGRLRGIPSSLRNLGVIAFQERDYAAARALFEESLGFARRVGDPTLVGIILPPVVCIRGLHP